MEDKGSSLIPAIATLIGLLLALLFQFTRRSKPRAALNSEKWQKFQLVEKKSLSHNVVLLRFALQTPDTILGLPIGQHISIQGITAEGKEVTRSYTPVTLDTDVGHVDFVIKLYPEGAMSQYLAKAEQGNFVAMRGPKGRFKYTPNMVKAFGMIGGGTGITPMFQLAKAILQDPNDTTTVHLISANVAEEDILLRDELDAFAAQFPARFSVFYVLNKPPETWEGGVGYVSKEMIQSRLPHPSDDVKILYCGPPAMNKAMAATLEELGYTADMTFKF